MRVIPVLGRLRQEDHRFEASLRNLARYCLKIKNKGRAWWHTLVIPVLERLRQENRRFVTNLSNL